MEISEVEFEEALPELRLGTLDMVISDEYDVTRDPDRRGSSSSHCAKRR